MRPMKDRVRQAVFDLLGPRVEGKHTVDLFAGTGALGLEALSRGARRATFIEQHVPTARLIEKNVAMLGLQDRAEVVTGDAFVRVLWEDRLGTAPWLVLCSPPYAYFVDRVEQMVELLAHLVEAAPQQSVFVVESDERFDPQLLPHPGAWDLRAYPPAQISLLDKS